MPVSLLILEDFHGLRRRSVLVARVQDFHSGELRVHFPYCRFHGIADDSFSAHHEIRSAVFSGIQGSDADLRITITPDFFENGSGECPLLADHGKQRSRIVEISYKPSRKRIVHPSELSHPFDKLHASEIQMFFHVSERCVPQSFDCDFIGFAIVSGYSRNLSEETA